MTDARQFNIRGPDGRLLCPACGFSGYSDEPAYDERGGVSGTALCPCCLWEPGFDDEAAASSSAGDTILASLRAYRADWRSSAAWRGREAEKPSGWDGEVQLASLFETAPNVR